MDTSITCPHCGRPLSAQEIRSLQGQLNISLRWAGRAPVIGSNTHIQPAPAPSNGTVLTPGPAPQNEARLDREFDFGS